MERMRNKLKGTKAMPKQNRRQQFADISFGNTQIVDDLIKEARHLSANKHDKEAMQLARIAKKVLDNNKRFQTMVGDVLSNTD